MASDCNLPTVVPAPDSSGPCSPTPVGELPPAPESCASFIAGWYNTEQSATATCPEGFTGDPVTATVPAYTFLSYASQEDADQLAYDVALAQAELALDCTEAPLLVLEVEDE